mmetsp:Transcript_4674/g.7516  ORF Transcript_4674/g.7516 Transcript_4674/m.7516 type:complete len:303 (-) Transcript_4674:22-930(-)
MAGPLIRVLGARGTISPMLNARHLARAAVFSTSLRNMATTSPTKPGPMQTISKMFAAIPSLPHVPRVPENYWEETWPRLQIEAARYGIIAAAAGGSLYLFNFAMGVANFFVTVPAGKAGVALIYGTGAGTAAAIGGGVILANRVISVNPDELKELAFALVKRDFLIERQLGGSLQLGPVNASMVNSAKIVLKDRPGSYYLRDFDWKNGDAKIAFQVVGSAGWAMVTCKATKAMGSYNIEQLAVDVKVESIADTDRLHLLRGKQADNEILDILNGRTISSWNPEQEKHPALSVGELFKSVPKQ